MKVYMDVNCFFKILTYVHIISQNMNRCSSLQVKFVLDSPVVLITANMVQIIHVSLLLLSLGRKLSCSVKTFSVSGHPVGSQDSQPLAGFIR